MKHWQITPEALKMSWKMVDTILPRHGMTGRERNALLTALTLIAMDDLLRADAITWTRPLPPRAILVFERPKDAAAGSEVEIRIKEAEKTRLLLRTDPAPSELDRAVEWVEEVFDQHRLSEEERATLYTALPCLGLHGVREYLNWTVEPPFSELA